MPPRVMRLYFDLDKGHFVSKAGYPSKLTRLDFKRGDSTEIRLGFYRGTTQEILSGSPSLELMLKPEGKYDADPVVDSSTWTNGTLVAMDYVCNPSFNTTELDALLLSGDADEDNDVASTDLMFEISWSEDGGTTWRSSDMVTARVFNDVVKGSEGAPTAGTPGYPTAALVNAALVDISTAETDIVANGRGYVAKVDHASGARNIIDTDLGKLHYSSGADFNLDSVTVLGWFDVFNALGSTVAWTTGSVYYALGRAAVSTAYTMTAGHLVRFIHLGSNVWLMTNPGEYVDAEVEALIDAAPGALDTLNELAASLSDDADFAGTMTTALALKAPLESPTLTGTPEADTAAPATNTTQLATTAFVQQEITAKAPLASPTLTGTPEADTAATATNTTQLATTEFVQQEITAQGISTAYGLISCQAGSTAETTTDSTPRIVQAWNTNGLSTGTTVDHTDDSILVAALAVFNVSCSVSFSGTAAKEYQLELYKYDDSGAAWSATGFSADVVLDASGSVVSVSISGLISLDVNDKVALYHSSSDGGTAFTATEAQLSVCKV